MCKLLILVGAWLVFGIGSNPLQAQSIPAGQYDDPRLDAIPEARVLPPSSRHADQFGVYSENRLWPSNVKVLRVCFLKGPLEVRTRIADIARRWIERTGSPISFDFGEPARLCDNQFSHIRVGFEDKGYWSNIGTDSAAASQARSSINFEEFDKEVGNTKTKSDDEFRRIVLHEFGHALGFDHEHQHPFTYCEDEYNWDVIYKWLEGPPNKWSKEQVDQNMRALHDSDLKVSEFDPKSIMLYAFPESYFKQGRASPCYSGYNTDLSALDRQLLKEMYPPVLSDPAAPVSTSSKSPEPRTSTPTR